MKELRSAVIALALTQAYCAEASIESSKNLINNNALVAKAINMDIFSGKKTLAKTELKVFQYTDQLIFWRNGHPTPIAESIKNHANEALTKNAANYSAETKYVIANAFQAATLFYANDLFYRFIAEDSSANAQDNVALISILEAQEKSAMSKLYGIQEQLLTSEIRRNISKHVANLLKEKDDLKKATQDSMKNLDTMIRQFIEKNEALPTGDDFATEFDFIYSTVWKQIASDKEWFARLPDHFSDLIEEFESISTEERTIIVDKYKSIKKDKIKSEIGADSDVIKTVDAINRMFVE